MYPTPLYGFFLIYFFPSIDFFHFVCPQLICREATGLCILILLYDFNLRSPILKVSILGPGCRMIDFWEVNGSWELLLNLWWNSSMN